MHHVDAVVVGAGAAGLFCAGVAGQRGLKVLVIDHAPKLAEKIRISGGGRCNFTNRDAAPANFISANPHFCRSALARYTPQDFIALVQRHRIAFHEKHKGQLFCDESSEEIIAMLLRECEQGHVTRWQPCAVKEIRQLQAAFELDTDRGGVRCAQVVVATGGLPIPKIGASDFGYRAARQFGHRIVETRPALVPLTFDAAGWAPFAGLAGLSLEARVETGSGKARAEFLEDLLFTHRGLSGPAILQISSYWQPGTPIRLDLAPSVDLAAALLAAKNVSRRKLGNELAEMLPRRLADTWLAGRPDLAERTLPELRDRDLQQLAAGLQRWDLVPSGTEGYRKAEVTAGGVDTRELSSQTMESARVPGLYFIGEVVDVTGWLGGYNFQWAWASAAACARGLPLPG
ncbi:MAG TPA: NAD(P)/FAD-dependent oxidoreductase [Albitalea sp.]|nr:NAD(P)/FAD-dependent oxidoreductase [Albitalea sp.]